MEGRSCRYTEQMEGTMTETSRSTIISTKLDRIATLAKQMPVNEQLLYHVFPYHQLLLSKGKNSGFGGRP